MKRTLFFLIHLTLFSAAVAQSTPQLQERLDRINRVDIPDSTLYMSMVDSVAAMASEAGDVDAQMQCLLDRVMYLTYYSDKAQALQHINAMQGLVEHHGANPKTLYDAWMQVINGYNNDSRTIFAMEQLQNMLDYANSRHDYYGLANVYAMYGNLYSNNYAEAFKNLDLALEYMNMSGNPQLTPGIYYLMAKSALNDNRPKEVLQHTKEMVEAPGGQSYKHLANYLEMMAYSEMGDQPNAANSYAAIEQYWQNPAALGIHQRDVISAMLKYLVSNGRSNEAMLHIASLDNSYALTKKEVEAAHFLTSGNLKNATEALSQLADLRNDVIANQQRARMRSVNEYMVNRKLQEQTHHDDLANAHRFTWICIAIIVALLAAIGALIYKMRKLKKANQELNDDWHRIDAARQEAVRLSDMKSTFIDNMSHELRTPLNSIMGFTEILNNPEFKPTEEKRNGMLQHIHTQSEMLIHLLDNVVTLSRIDAGDIVPNIERIHLSEIIEEVCDPLYRDVAKDVNFNVERGLLSGVEIFTDREFITTVTKAVLENAVKFTQRGTIEFDCATDEQGNLTMTVADTGDGIPAADAHRIYDRFEKLGRIEQGFGLGLSCARELLDMMGGTITLDPSYSRGARFIITIKNEKP